MAVRENIQLMNSPSRCPYCHDSLDSLNEINACAGCGARHHSECFSDHGACASCGETSRLVPEKRASNEQATLAKSVERLPEGSLELTQSADGSAAITWPMIPDDQVEKSYLLAFLTMPLLFGFYVLFWIWRYRNSKTLLSFEGDQLRFEKPGSSLERMSFEATRHEVQNIELESGALFVTVRGQKKLLISSNGVGHILKKQEIAALYQVLNSWHTDRVTRPLTGKQEKGKKLLKKE